MGDVGRPENADSAATFEKIRAAALKIVQESGVEALSIRRVAKDAGVSIGTLRYYFDTREALVEGCLDCYHERLLTLEQSMTELLLASQDPRAAVASIVRAIFPFLSLQPELHRLRLLSTLQQGQVTEERRAHMHPLFLKNAATALTASSGKSPAELRLVVDSIMRMISWYAACSDDELCYVTDEVKPSDARETLREHCVKVALTLVFGQQSEVDA